MYKLVKYKKIWKFIKNPIFSIIRPYIVKYLYKNLKENQKKNKTHTKEHVTIAQIGILMANKCNIEDITNDLKNTRNIPKNIYLVGIMISICIFFIFLSLTLIITYKNNKTIVLFSFILLNTSVSALSAVYSYLFGFRQSVEITLFLINILVYEYFSSLSDKKN